MTTPARERVMALDVFRGLAMALMVLVGNPGSLAIYTQLDHAAWDGLTLTDVVFPSFLWIVGVSITLSAGGRLAKGVPRGVIARQALRRSAVLYGIGVGIYAIGSFDLHTLRLLGVLQRIAICSLVATVLYLWGSVRSWVGWVCGLLIGYWLVMRFIPVPGFGAGDWSVEGNLAHYVDRVVLGSHNYTGTGTWDPEGMLSTVPAIATTALGMLGGVLMGWRRRCGWMVVVGVVLVVAGLGISHWVPINKKLWSDSFCMLMAGLDFIVLGGLLWLIDARGFRRGWTLPLAFGQNALAVYILSEVSGAVLWSYPHDAPMHGWIFNAVFAGHGSEKMSSLLYAICTLAIIAALAMGMRRRGWVLKL